MIVRNLTPVTLSVIDSLGDNYIFIEGLSQAPESDEVLSFISSSEGLEVISVESLKNATVPGLKKYIGGGDMTQSARSEISAIASKAATVRYLESLING